jgi:hypothetical protein
MADTIISYGPNAALILTESIQGPSGGTIGTITLTGDVEGSASGGTIPTEVVSILNKAIPAFSPGFLQWTGSALEWTTISAANPTGTGFWFESSSSLNAAAVTLTGDVSQGALASPNVPLTVTGIQGKAVPSLVAGFFQYSGSAWVLASILAAQLPTITLTGQVTGSASGGSIATTLTSANLPAITLTGQVTGSASGGSIATTLTSANLPTITLNGDVSGIDAGGTISTTVTQLSQGTILIANSVGTLTWWAGATPQLTQNSTTSATAQNFTIAPQVSTATNGTPGSFVVALGAPTGTGSNPTFQITQSGNSPAQLFQIGIPLTGAYAGVCCLWLTDGSAPTGSNPQIITYGGKTVINNVVAIQLAIGGTSYHAFGPSYVEFFSIAVDIGTSSSGVISIAPMSAAPTAQATNGFLLYNDKSTNDGLMVCGPSSGVFMLESLAPIWAGTQNTQTGVIRKYGQMLRTTNATATTAITIPLATSSTSVALVVTAIGRQAVTAATSTTAFIVAQVVNNGGTLTEHDVSHNEQDGWGSGNLVTVIVSTTNILIQVTGVASTNIDWTVEVTAIYS